MTTLSVKGQKIISSYNNFKNTTQAINSSNKKPIVTKPAWNLQAAQQAFSEKYGVPTFTKTGLVSTIPQTRPASGINVGVGSTGLTVQALNDLVAKLAPQKALVPLREVFSGAGGYTTQPTDSKLIAGEIPIPEQSIIGSFSSTIQQYGPYLILGGIALAGLMLLKK